MSPHRLICSGKDVRVLTNLCVRVNQIGAGSKLADVDINLQSFMPPTG